MNERSVFLDAVEIEDPIERRAHLDRACAGDPGLREVVDRLLAAHEKDGPFLDRPAQELLETVDRPALSERAGKVIGPYKLMEQIGEGGFGLVFVAEQLQPVGRKVALKVIKPGMEYPRGHRPVRGRAAGAGADGPPEHSPGARRRRDGEWPARARI